MGSPRYSIVVPVFNEEEVLPELYDRLRLVIDGLDGPAEIIFVNDGSADHSLALLKRFHANGPRVRIVSLSRNFGHQAAITAGLAHARGDAVAILDADLQDPPELLPKFFKGLGEGWDIVYGIRKERKEGAPKRLAYFVFYRLLRRMANIHMPLDSGDFCAMSRRVVDHLNALGESDRFIRGLRAWLGFRQTGIVYERDRRRAGVPKYTLMKLLKLSLGRVDIILLRPPAPDRGDRPRHLVDELSGDPRGPLSLHLHGLRPRLHVLGHPDPLHRGGAAPHPRSDRRVYRTNLAAGQVAAPLCRGRADRIRSGLTEQGRPSSR